MEKGFGVVDMSRTKVQREEQNQGSAVASAQAMHMTATIAH
jgi:hypothetical protein